MAVHVHVHKVKFNEVIDNHGMPRIGINDMYMYRYSSVGKLAMSCKLIRN